MFATMLKFINCFGTWNRAYCFFHRVQGGYSPNSHNCMPCELVNDRLKEIVRKSFDDLQKSHQTMLSLYNLIVKTVHNFPNDRS
jgi:hypothetical protein